MQTPFPTFGVCPLLLLTSVQYPYCSGIQGKGNYTTITQYYKQGIKSHLKCYIQPLKH